MTQPKFYHRRFVTGYCRIQTEDQSDNREGTSGRDVQAANGGAGENQAGMVSHSGCQNTLFRAGVNAMADVCPADPEDNVFRDIGGVIGDALEIAGNQQHIQRLVQNLG